ncbi:MAG TPA: trimeric intracellular cation channel family protein [Vulgatibacter sp.]
MGLLERILDLVGSFAFAVSGAMAAVRHGFDVFGILVLAFVTAVAGGIVRDVLIGALPPAAFATWHYLAVALTAGVLTFRFHPAIKGTRPALTVFLFFDAAGLATFAVVGTNKALAYGLDWAMSAVLGMVTGIGGGMLRDVLSTEVPSVLRVEIYAVAALAGALVVALGSLLPLPQPPFTVVGAALCFTLRLLGIYRGWKLPSAR